MRAVFVVAALALGGGLAGGAHSRPVASERVLETIVVSNTNPKPVFSSTVLKRDRRYRIVASGTVSDWCAEGAACTPPATPRVGVDALYCYLPIGTCSPKQLWRQLQINGKGLDELAGKAGSIPYSGAHRYTVEVTGIAGKLQLVALDATISASDNSGQFKVEIVDLGPDRIVVTWRANGRHERSSHARGTMTIAISANGSFTATGQATFSQAKGTLRAVHTFDPRPQPGKTRVSKVTLAVGAPRSSADFRLERGPNRGGELTLVARVLASEGWPACRPGATGTVYISDGRAGASTSFYVGSGCEDELDSRRLYASVSTTIAAR